MSHWSPPPLDRQQAALFYPTLEDSLPADHPVRLLDEILDTIDWTAWETQYHGRLGQPPIHPRVLAAVILYGLTVGLRSSRQVERACGNALDFIWLSSGRQMDHSTLCEFRVKFSGPLKDLFRQVGRLAMSMGLVRLNQVGLDGTRVRANSSRHATASAATLEARLAALDGEVERLMSEAEAADRQDETLYGESSPNALPAELRDVARRQERLRAALAAAQATDARRAARGEGAKSAKVPVADPESAVLPNKEGGHAPNYSPLAAVDGERGFIVSAEIVDSESGATVAVVDGIAQDLGACPVAVLADSAHGTGVNLTALAARGIAAYIPPVGEVTAATNPAARADLQQPVAERDWAALPVNPQSKKLDKSAFIYDREKDCYWCPQGRRLNYRDRSTAEREGGLVAYRKYQCGDCDGCPLGGRCLGSGAKSRTVSRDEHEPAREAMRERLKTEAGRTMYGRRRWLCETPFAVLKSRLGLRQFLLRGQAKVATEWRWACAAFNLVKLAREVRRMRVKFAAELA